MPDPHTIYTAFVGTRRLASGARAEIAVAVKRALREDPAASPLAFNDSTGKQEDFDLRGTEKQVTARYAEPAPAPESGPEPEPEARGRGRPRLGVIAREVTLLPEHWEWLSAQPGGASVVLRKLVHDARRAGGARDRTRQAQERAYHVMVALAGNLAGFEEASRALFAGDSGRLAQLMARWPRDVREHITRLAAPDDGAAAPPA
jgi:hypothetical protein